MCQLCSRQNKVLARCGILLTVKKTVFAFFTAAATFSLAFTVNNVGALTLGEICIFLSAVR